MQNQKPYILINFRLENFELDCFNEMHQAYLKFLQKCPEPVIDLIRVDITNAVLLIIQAKPGFEHLITTSFFNLHVMKGAIKKWMRYFKHRPYLHVYNKNGVGERIRSYDTHKKNGDGHVLLNKIRKERFAKMAWSM